MSTANCSFNYNHKGLAGLNANWCLLPPSALIPRNCEQIVQGSRWRCCILYVDVQSSDTDTVHVVPESEAAESCVIEYLWADTGFVTQTPGYGCLNVDVVTWNDITDLYCPHLHTSQSQNLKLNSLLNCCQWLTALQTEHDQQILGLLNRWKILHTITPNWNLR